MITSTPAARNAIAIGIVIGLLAFRAIRAGNDVREMFSVNSRRAEKASSIIEWFQRTPAPTYTQYKTAFAEPNIVEYEDMLALHQQGNLTQKSAEEKLR